MQQCVAQCNRRPAFFTQHSEMNTSLAHSKHTAFVKTLWHMLHARLTQPSAPVILPPVPAWKYWSRVAGHALLSILAAVACFSAGRYFPVSETTPLSSPQTALTAPAGPDLLANGDLRQEGPAPADVPQDSGLNKGLAVQNLVAWNQTGDSSRLRYEYTLVNHGPRFVGKATLLLGGLVDGSHDVLEYPGDPNDPKFNLNVSRFLKMEGSIAVPAGFAPQTLQLRLSDPSGPRVHHVTVVRSR
jgi:hypothetical protein